MSESKHEELGDSVNERVQGSDLLEQQDGDSELKESVGQLQVLLQQVPEELLLAEVASRVERDPNREVPQMIRQVQTFQGPLPPPRMLAQYNDVHEGLAERIVQLTEKQQAHRIKMESDSVSASIWSERLGQVFAFLLCVLIISGSMWLIYNGREVSGSLLAGGTISSVAYVFITGRKKNNSDEEQSD